MKKMLFILGFIIILSGCNGLNFIDMSVYGLLENVEYYDFAEYDLSGIKNFKHIGDFLQEHITFKADIGEEFLSPEETMKRGVGDCEDFSFLMANIAYIIMGIKMDIVIMNTSEWGRTVVEGGIGNHICPAYNGEYYSGQYGYVVYIEQVLYKYTFDEIFY